MPDDLNILPEFELYAVQGYDCLLVKRGFGGRLGGALVGGMGAWWCGYVRIPNQKPSSWYIKPLEEVVELTFEGLHRVDRPAWADRGMGGIPYGKWVGFDTAHGMRFGTKSEARNTILKMVVALITSQPQPEYPKILRGRVHLTAKKTKKRRRRES